VLSRTPWLDLRGLLLAEGKEGMEGDMRVGRGGRERRVEKGRKVRRVEGGQGAPPLRNPGYAHETQNAHT